MLDRVDALLDRELGAGDALAVRGDAVALAMRLLHQRRDLAAGELRRVGVLELDAAGARGHHLDEIRAQAQLLAHRAPHVVGPVGLAVHALEPAPARPGRGDDAPAREHARAAEGSVAHRLACLDDDVPVRADVAHGGDAAAEHLAQVGGEHVPVDARPQRLGARLGGWTVGLEMGVRVDQARHQRAPLELDRPRTLGDAIGGGADRGDATVLHQHRRRVAERRAGAVEESPAGQPEAPARRRRVREQARHASGHGATIVVITAAPRSNAARRGPPRAATRARRPRR